MADRAPEIRTFGLEESGVIIGIDFQNFPAVVNGLATLTAPAINLLDQLPSSGISFGMPTILAADFDDIPSGQGVKCAVTLVEKGTYVFECHVTFSTGGPGAVRGTIIVR